MSECKCTMAKSVLGDGCPHCQPQTYIKDLEEWLDEERQEAEALRQHAEAMAEVLEAIDHGLRMGFTPASLLETGTPIRKGAEAALTAYRAESAKGGV